MLAKGGGSNIGKKRGALCARRIGLGVVESEKSKVANEISEFPSSIALPSRWQPDASMLFRHEYDACEVESIV